jgi:streptomycin 6-kinase
LSEFQVPRAVARMNIEAHGEAGRAWLSARPALLEELQARWKITIGTAFQGGVVGFVAPAERSSGERMVVKVSYVEEETRHEPDALSFWNGDGAARLLDAVPDRGALLLERLEPGTSLESHTDRDEAISIACSLLRRLWRPVSDPHPFTTVPHVVSRWARELPQRYERFGAPFEAPLVEQAVALCAEFAASNEEPVLAHRDYHLGNVLAARREPWLLIDPKPLVGERAFDTGHLVRSLLPAHPDLAETVRIARRLAAELHLEIERVTAWAFIRSVEDALWGLGVGTRDVERDLERARILSELAAGRP